MYYVNEDVKNLYRVKFHEKRGSVLRLDMNENPIGLPEDFVEEVKKKITPSFLATYPEKDELIKLIAKHNRIGENQITVTAGSDEAMRIIFQCFGEKNKRSLTVSPTFEMYDVYSKMFGMVHDMVNYEEDFSVSVDEIIKKITTDTRIVILLNPNSPIGTVYSDNELESIIRVAKKNKAIVVIDEAYHYFYKHTFMDKIKEHKNLIILRTFSKLFSIAGLRVGYAVSNPDIIQYMENAEATFNVNNVGILFASEVLKRPDIMQELQKKEAEGRKWLTEKLKENKYRYCSKNGNYVLFFPKKNSTQIVKELKEKNIWIRDYSKGILKGWIRVSTGDVESMQKFWKSFKQCEE